MYIGISLIILCYFITLLCPVTISQGTTNSKTSSMDGVLRGRSQWLSIVVTPLSLRPCAASGGCVPGLQAIRNQKWFGKGGRA
jgi:hypothetical protein